LLNCISIYTVLGTSSSSLSLLLFIFLDDEKSIIATWRIAEGMEDSLRRLVWLKIRHQDLFMVSCIMKQQLPFCLKGSDDMVMHGDDTVERVWTVPRVGQVGFRRRTHDERSGKLPLLV
jgi:hypothetical protein